jgi:predicted nucleotidyltransferase
LYGADLKDILLFGSYARGEQDNESDLDILIVLCSYERYGSEIERTGEVISQLSLKYGISISRKFIKEIDWLSADSSLLRNVRAEALSL